jgi:hypothetical protein
MIMRQHRWHVILRLTIRRDTVPRIHYRLASRVVTGGGQGPTAELERQMAQVARPREDGGSGVKGAALTKPRPGPGMNCMRPWVS